MSSRVTNLHVSQPTLQQLITATGNCYRITLALGLKNVSVQPSVTDLLADF